MGNPESEKIIIIGAGIAGLSCGSYLQMNGFQTEILEAALLPGGLCTAWHRGPYTFDGCLRWLVGARPPSAFNQMWRELGALNGRKVLTYRDILHVEYPSRKTLAIPADLDELARLFKSIAPEDSRLIDRLVADARRCAPLEPPIEKPLELMSPREKMRAGLRYFPMFPVLLRWKRLSVAEYLARYRNDDVREALKAVAGDPRMSALVLPMVLAFRTRGNTGFVAGGSWDFAMGIADRYRKLGGNVRYNARVTAVTVENNRATGAQCADGTTIPASLVISCADGHATIFDMLGGRFVDKKILYLYQNCQLFPSLIQVSLGLNRTFPEIPHTLHLALARPLRVDDKTHHERLEVESFGSDSALCPEGKMVVTVRMPGDYDFWTRLKKSDVRRYRAEKKALLRAVIAILDDRFPSLGRHIERFDLATPSTFERYTGNWQASYEGWLPTPRILGRRIPYTLPGLKNFYMAGQWVVAGGGLPSAALSGRYVAQMICAANGKPFAASVP